MLQRVRFDVVAVKETRRWKNADGRKRQETRTFYQTVNPYNRNADGSMKTREQIMVEIAAARDAWLKEPPNAS